MSSPALAAFLAATVGHMEHVDPADINVSFEPQGPGTHAFGAKVDVIPREGEIVRFTVPLGEQEVVRVIHEHPSGRIQIILRDPARPYRT